MLIPSSSESFILNTHICRWRNNFGLEIEGEREMERKMEELLLLVTQSRRVK